MSSMWAEPGAILLAAAVPGALMGLLLCIASRIPPRGMSRRRVTCPVHERPAAVDFVLEDDGGEVYADVVGCSLVARGHEIDCGKPCRSTSIAPFGTTRLMS